GRSGCWEKNGNIEKSFSVSLQLRIPNYPFISTHLGFVQILARTSNSEHPPGCESQQLEMQNGEISGKFGGGGGGDHGSAQEFASQAQRGGSGCSALFDREYGRYTVHTFAEFVEAGEASGCA
ncbi:hypothetical protein KI387_001469, partial [Taxus chinensis]